ncbi:MAG: hypothetical protein WCK02_07500 [Bacteroidota bacterium]
MLGNLLIEHEWYPFKVLKEIDFPDGESMFVLEDPNGYKHLLRQDYYKHYQIKPEQYINCRIDKINCSGRIFLEPEHPIYKEGESYSFNFIAKKIILNSLNKEEQIIVVSDIFNQEIILPDTNFQSYSDKIECIVENIKKGKLMLSVKDAKQRITGLKEGDWFESIIDRVITNTEKEEFYVIVDNQNNEFLLKKKYYANYKYSIGNMISCRITKIRSQFDYVVEPKNPYYEIGSIYDFKIEFKEIVDTYFHEKSYFLVFSDIFGIECRSEVEEQYYENFQVGETVRCSVVKIKKSKLVLKLEH